MTQQLILPHPYDFSFDELEGAIHNAMMITIINMGLVPDRKLELAFEKLNKYYSGSRTILDHVVLKDMYKKKPKYFLHSYDYCKGLIELLTNNYNTIYSKVVLINNDSDHEWIEENHNDDTKLHVSTLPLNKVGSTHHETYYVISYDYDKTARGSLVYVITLPTVDDEHNHIMAVLVSTLDGAHTIQSSVRNLDDMREMARVLRHIEEE